MVFDFSVFLKKTTYFNEEIKRDLLKLWSLIASICCLLVSSILFFQEARIEVLLVYSMGFISFSLYYALYVYEFKYNFEAFFGILLFVFYTLAYFIHLKYNLLLIYSSMILFVLFLVRGVKYSFLFFLSLFIVISFSMNSTPKDSNYLDHYIVLYVFFLLIHLASFFLIFFLHKQFLLYQEKKEIKDFSRNINESKNELLSELNKKLYKLEESIDIFDSRYSSDGFSHDIVKKTISRIKTKILYKRD